jgi:hypothetical protein
VRLKLCALTSKRCCAPQERERSFGLRCAGLPTCLPLKLSFERCSERKRRRRQAVELPGPTSSQSAKVTATADIVSASALTWNQIYTRRGSAPQTGGSFGRTSTLPGPLEGRPPMDEGFDGGVSRNLSPPDSRRVRRRRRRHQYCSSITRRSSVISSRSVSSDCCKTRQQEPNFSRWFQALLGPSSPFSRQRPEGTRD